MESTPNTSNSIANHALATVLDSFNYQLKGKEALNVLP